MPHIVLATCVALAFFVVARGAKVARPPVVRTTRPAIEPPARASAPTSSAQFPLLQLTIADEHWRALADARARALEKGMMLAQDQGKTVPVAVRYGAETATGAVRLKGDWLDHLDSDQWSLRLELREPIAGMRRFSVQHPKTRGYIFEWLVMVTARREGLLAPRASFVRVEINGKLRGLYYLEEHFAKELLESQGRREGPIVRFNEEAVWLTWQQFGYHRTGTLPSEVMAAASLFSAAPEAYGEAALTHPAGLDARLQRSLAQTRELQDLLVASLPDRPVRRLQALARLQSRTIDDVFAPDRAGKWLALYTLFHCLHGLSWHQLRFYHDPVLDRLEPIAFDTGADLRQVGSELPLSTYDAKLFMLSDAAWEAAYVALGRWTEPDWRAELERALRPATERALGAMADTGLLPPGFGAELVFGELLPKQVAALREIVRPKVAAGFAARVVGARTEAGGSQPIVEIEAWAAADVPVRVHAFRTPKGRTVRAADAAPTLAGLPNVDAGGAAADGSVLLPRDGSRVTFQFPLDRRLANLRDVQAVKTALRDGSVPDPSKLSTIDVLFRPVAERSERVQTLTMRHLVDPGADLLGRPKPPTLAEALARHAFLAYDLANDALYVARGRHQVSGDLVIPEGRTLNLQAGAQLLLAKGAVILASAIHAEGTPEAPVVLAPASREDGWAGLLVIGSAGSAPCELRHCRIEGTTSIHRGGWQTTGGVTFYRAPVTIQDSAFLDSRCEDALDVFGAHLSIARTELRGGTSDLLDCRFVDGEVVDCKFADCAGDATDFRSSQVRVTGCRFTSIGGKAISAGEDSQVFGSDCAVESASIAVAAMDRSQAQLEKLTVRSVVSFVLAAYTRKPEYGPATIAVHGLDWTGGGAPKHLAQTGSTITVDGQAVPSSDVDVAELYRTKVLGK